MQRAPLYVADMSQNLNVRINQWLESAARHRAARFEVHVWTVGATWERDNEKVTLEKYLRIKHAKRTRLSYFHFPPSSSGKVVVPDGYCAHTTALHARNIFYQTAQSEKEFSFLSSDFFLSDMRGKCIRRADASRAIFSFSSWYEGESYRP